MKRLLLILSFVLGLTISTQAQSLTRSQLDQILLAATTQVNADLGKNYTVADAYFAYQNGYLTIVKVRTKTYRYNYIGCIDIILINDR